MQRDIYMFLTIIIGGMWSWIIGVKYIKLLQKGIIQISKTEKEREKND